MSRIIAVVICYFCSLILFILAIVRYFGFPNAEMVKMGLFFALGGMLFLLCGTYLYRRK